MRAARASRRSRRPRARATRSTASARRSRVLEHASDRAARRRRPGDAPLRRRLRRRGDRRRQTDVPRPRTSARGSAGGRSSSARATAPTLAASVPATSRSNGAARLPRRICSARRSTSRAATASFAPRRRRRARRPTLGGVAAAEHRGGGFEALISRGDLSLGVILLSLASRLFWGAAHALTPGHGKAIVAGYLVGTEGRPRDAVAARRDRDRDAHDRRLRARARDALLSQFIVPETLYPWLTLRPACSSSRSARRCCRAVPPARAR